MTKEERFEKWYKRHRLAITIMGIVVFMVLFFIVLWLIGLINASDRTPISPNNP
jgi:hypothetical protein